MTAANPAKGILRKPMRKQLRKRKVKKINPIHAARRAKG